MVERRVSRTLSFLAFGGEGVFFGYGGVARGRAVDSWVVVRTN